jgi:DNA-binding CsgD family transcriptional regulator
MTIDVVGRDEELGALHAFLERRVPVTAPTAVALEGEAGIGKSTLWRAAIDAAREGGARVLVARPAETERGFEHAGLADLFEDVLEETLPALTMPQRRALEVALLVDDADDAAVDARALGVGVRSALQVLSADGLLVLAVDDVQWLDASSANALGFALRRLSEAPVLLLWTRRLGDGRPPAALEDAVGEERIERVRVGPLSLGAIQRIIQRRLSRVVSRPTLLRIHQASGGNPFYALELARALEVGDAVRDPTQPLPIPERLEELVSARLGGFDGATRDALVLVSAQARLTVAQLAAAGIDERALDPVLSEHVLELVDGTVRFTHPLLASALYQGLTMGERQRAHRRLAELAKDPVARARHLASSTDRPDEELALALEHAATDAAQHGAQIAAAGLAEQALRLTPADDLADADRRAAAAARAHAAAGEVGRARVLAADVLARASAGPERALALALLAEVDSEDPRLAIPLLHEALREPGAPRALRATLHQRLSLLVRFTEGLAEAERHARASVALAEQLGDVSLLASALAGLALIRFNAGQPGALGLAGQAHELAARMPTSQAAADAGFALAHVLVWSGRFERARTLLDELFRGWSDRDERIAGYALWYRAFVELRCGELELAEELAEQARALSAQYARDEVEPPQSLYPLALVAAHRGDLDRARELAQETRRLAELHGSRMCAPTATLGVVELWSADPEAAVRAFAATEAIEDAPDAFDPGMCWWRAEHVEALLELGRVDDAAERLEEWEADARRLENEWVLAEALRCRGLVAAASGDVEGAASLLAGAVEATRDPFVRARALLALGVARRRLRQKRAAREAIETALAEFRRIGAPGWAEKARAELGRIGGRERVEGLTPAERRVAKLVATGRTNAEVAAALFLTERTVASHLTRVYAKLGVRSRTELAGKVQLF